jgi:hypothetical protein
VIFPGRELELRYYLAQVAVLNEMTQRHFTSINAGIYQGASHLQFEKQLDEVRQAHKRLVELRRVTCKEQEGSPFPMAIAAGSIK